MNDDAFIFSEPQILKNERPWEAGDAFGISKINLLDGRKTVLKQADSTHDYFFEQQADGSFVGDENTTWIYVNTYPSE